MGAADKDPGPGGGQSEGIRDVLQGVSAGDVDFQVGDVGPDPLHGTGPGQFSMQSRAADHRDTDEDTVGRGIVLSATGVRYGGGRS